MAIPLDKVFATYGMQVGGFVARVASLAVILPLLARDAPLLGIYSICTSILFFVHYADLGFLSAAKKFAAGANASGDADSERRYLSFALFASLAGAAAIGAGCAIFAFQPGILLASTAGVDETSSDLLFITAAALPFLAAHRVVLAAFEIRIEGFLAQRWSIASSLVATLVGVVVLTSQGDEGVVTFFALSQVFSILGIVGMSATARRRYGYGLLDLLKGARFDRAIFSKTLGLSATGVWITFCWVCFFELDLLYIGKFHGAGSVAIYSVALTLCGVLRTFQGILFLPMVTHINRIVGSASIAELRGFLRSTILDAAPIVVIPIVLLVVLAGSTIRAWVGNDYEASAFLVVALLLPMAAASFAYPWSALLVAKEWNAESRWISALQVFVFWAVVFGLDSISLAEFAVLKASILLATAIFCAARLHGFLSGDSGGLLAEFLVRTVPGSTTAAGFGFLFVRLVDVDRSAVGMVRVASGFAGILALAFAAQAICSPALRARMRHVYRGVFG